MAKTKFSSIKLNLKFKSFTKIIHLNCNLKNRCYIYYIYIMYIKYIIFIMYVCVCIYIYIYIYINFKAIKAYIYIYIYVVGFFLAAVE